jgi:hypothetical protein
MRSLPARPSRTRRSLAVAFCALALGLLGPVSAEARIKCWTNNQGVRECGNVIPPEYAQQEHAEVSRSGVTLGVTERARTAEELEAERARVEREETLRAEQERIAREQAERDQILLQTFSAEEDLLHVRDSQLTAVDTRIHHARQILGQLQESLKEHRQEAAALERSGQPVPPELHDTIAGVERRIAENEDFIEARHRERGELVSRFETDLERYRTLRR